MVGNQLVILESSKGSSKTNFRNRVGFCPWGGGVLWGKKERDDR